MKFSIPGNLLLFGEYLVTIPGGMGIAIATDAKAHFVAKRSDKASFLTTFEGKTERWVKNQTEKNLSLIDFIWNRLEQISPLPPLEIVIDTSEFSDSNGRKKGFGSSAAVTVGLTTLLLHYLKGEKPDPLNEVFPLALEIHRAFQGGLGSGYDIATSLFNGMGLFIGGNLPQWQPMDVWWEKQLLYIPGDEAVSSKKMVALFNNYRLEYPQNVDVFLKQNNELITLIKNCKTPPELKELFHQGYLLNKSIHEAMDIQHEGIGLSEQLNHYRQQGHPGKPLGAGGEIAAILLS